MAKELETVDVGEAAVVLAFVDLLDREPAELHAPHRRQNLFAMNEAESLLDLILQRWESPDVHFLVAIDGLSVHLPSPEIGAMLRVLPRMNVVAHCLRVRLLAHERSLLGALLTIDDVVLRDLRSDLHESQLDEVLHVLHRDFDILD